MLEKFYAYNFYAVVWLQV